MLPFVCALLLTAPTLDVQGTAFTFRAGFWNNLHHFLYVLGRAKNGEPDRTRDAVVKAPLDVDGLVARSDAERAAWDAAIAFYAAGPSKKDTVFDADLVKLARTLASLPDEGDPAAAGIDPALAATLKTVAPIYRAVWWTRHSQADARRRAEMQATLDMYEEINDRIYRVAAQQHVKVPDGLSHMLIFYTSGVITSDLIADHIPYAVHYGIWNRGNFGGMKEVFDTYWLPYLRGTGTFEQGIAALLAR